MSNTTFHSLYDSVFTKIKDYDLITLDMNEAFEIIGDYLRPAIALFSACTQDLSDYDTEIAQFNFKLVDKNFEILSNYMVICYLDATYIRTPMALKAQLSNTDFHKLDNKDMLGKAIEVRSMYKNENDQLMINYSHQHSTIFDEVIARGTRGRTGGVIR